MSFENGWIFRGRIEWMVFLARRGARLKALDSDIRGHLPTHNKFTRKWCAGMAGNFRVISGYLKLFLRCLNNRDVEIAEFSASRLSGPGESHFLQHRLRPQEGNRRFPLSKFHFLTSGGILTVSPATFAHQTMKYEKAAIQSILPRNVTTKNFLPGN